MRRDDRGDVMLPSKPSLEAVEVRRVQLRGLAAGQQKLGAQCTFRDRILGDRGEEDWRVDHAKICFTSPHRQG